MRFHRAPLFLLGLALLAAGAFPGCRGDRNLYRADRVAPMLSFEIKDGRGEILWKLLNRGGKTVSKIRYRDVPPGFVQEVPSGSGRPRDFRPGEPITVFLAFPDGWCRTSVAATGPDGYRTVYHQCARQTGG